MPAQFKMQRQQQQQQALMSPRSRTNFDQAETEKKKQRLKMAKYSSIYEAKFHEYLNLLEGIK